MVIELGDTAIADRAMFGAHRSADDARMAEVAEVECLTLRQIKNHLQQLQFYLINWEAINNSQSTSL